MDMPFGKYRGRPVDELPDDYVEWLLEQEWLKPSLRVAILERNEKHPLDRVLAKWQSTMALKFHPDRGGSHEAMLAVNEGAELFRRLIDEML